MDQFYPFGAMEGDMELPTPSPSDPVLTVSRQVDLPVPLSFFAQEQTSIYVRVVYS